MSRKGENIFRRKDGRWEARYIKGYELSWKIRYGFCYGKTYKEAKDKATRCKAALLAGIPIPVANNRHRFAYFCEEWLRLGELCALRWEKVLLRNKTIHVDATMPQPRNRYDVKRRAIICAARTASGENAGLW